MQFHFKGGENSRCGEISIGNYGYNGILHHTITVLMQSLLKERTEYMYVEVLSAPFGVLVHMYTSLCFHLLLSFTGLTWAIWGL